MDRGASRRRHRRVPLAINAACILVGAALLIWPALLNHYPIMFSDTGGLLSMGHEPEIGWDKPWVYGPLLRVTDGGLTLWLPALAQGLLVSHLLWMLQKAVVGARAWRHLLICAVLAAGSAAPWFTALLMPDIFAPVTVICLFLLGFAAPGRLSRAERIWLLALAAIAIAAHLAHLIVAAGCLAVVALLRWRRLAAAAAPLVAALGWLMVTNLVGNGVAGISPYGSIFALARLQADGPAALYLHDVCPAAGYRVCAWAGVSCRRIATNSCGTRMGRSGATDTARPISSARRSRWSPLRSRPIRCWRCGRRSATRSPSFPWVAVGDTLGPNHLDLTVLPRLQRFFPAAEAARFDAGLQAQGQLAADAAPFLWPHLPLLIAGLAGTLVALPLGWRRGWPALSALALMVLAGLLANAFATGALSHPHDRYEARIAWLLLLPPLLMVTGWRHRV